jgi:hypothetical protein
MPPCGAFSLFRRFSETGTLNVAGLANRSVSGNLTGTIGTSSLVQ